MTDNGDTPVHGGHSRRARPMQSLGPVRNLSETVREEVQRRLSVVTEKWCNNVIAGVEHNKRNAMNMWPQAMKIIGAEQVVNVNLATIAKWGLPADEVDEIIRASRESNAVGVDEAQRYALDLAKWCIAQEPHRRAEIIRALGGNDALALELPTADHANGHDSGLS